MSLSFEEYLKEARKSIIYRDRLPPNSSVNLVPLLYCGLKLCGEAGEVAEDIGKILRDDEGGITMARRDKVVKELGDVLWYWVNLCDLIGVSPEYVAVTNIKKLEARMANNTVHGSGSDR